MNGLRFQDLLETLQRLSTDPRVHPNTRVEIAYEFDTQWVDDRHRVMTETRTEQEPLIAILVNGCITLSATRSEPAIAR